jgi:hypothetical protein
MHFLASTQIPLHSYDRLLREAVKLAILSYPFMHQKVEFDKPELKIRRISKGMLPRLLFEFLCRENSWPFTIHPELKAFHKTKAYDFSGLNLAWTLINQYIYHKEAILPSDGYAQLPALIPNRHSKDFWSKRFQLSDGNLKAKAFLFTFMKASSEYDRRADFFKVELTPAHLSFLKDLREAYGNTKIKAAPYDSLWFWEEMDKRGGPIGLEIHDRPALILAGVASNKQWPLFEANSAKHQEYGKGILFSVIPNYQCTMHELPSFYKAMQLDGFALKYLSLLD